MKLADAAGNDIPGGSVSVATSSVAAGSFAYAALPSPVTLSANGVYYILSQETLGGDQWYDLDTTAQTTPDAVLSAAAWGSGSPYAAVSGTAGHMYGPLDFKYTVVGH